MPRSSSPGSDSGQRVFGILPTLDLGRISHLTKAGNVPILPSRQLPYRCLDGLESGVEAVVTGLPLE
jgi:hypothetical protein